MKSDRSETTGLEPRKLSRRNPLKLAGIGNAVATVVVARWENELDRGALEEQLTGPKVAAQASQPIWKLAGLNGFVWLVASSGSL
jgi:hypothetical protein